MHPVLEALITLLAWRMLAGIAPGIGIGAFALLTGPALILGIQAVLAEAAANRAQVQTPAGTAQIKR